MAEQREVRKRDSHVKLLRNMLKKSIEIVEDKNVSKNPHKELKSLRKNIETKKDLINELNTKILDLIDEEMIHKHLEEENELSIEVDTVIEVIEDELKTFEPNPTTEPLNESITTNSSTNSSNSSRVRLPKLEVKKYYGNPTGWSEFRDTFEVAVNGNNDLSQIEKFTYLKGYIGGDAEKCLEGLKLNAANYDHALKLLEERFGNKQLIISKFMTSLLNLNRVRNNNIKELRALYDKITVNVRGLLVYDIDSKQFSPMLIPILLQKLPQDIKLTLSKALNKDIWKLDDILQLLKEEIEARESCEEKESQENVNMFKPKPRGITTGNLMTINSKIKCCFCDQNHYADKCNVVTDLTTRREIIRNNKLCFRCLIPNHSIKNCRSHKKCYKCNSSKHHTAICDDGERRNDFEEKDKEEAASLLANNKDVSVLLQTAKATITDTIEKKHKNIRILLDPGSQRSYIKDDLARNLNLKPISNKLISVKTFGENNTQTIRANEYKCCIKGKYGENLYVDVLGVPKICSNISGQRIDIAMNEFDFTEDEVNNFNLIGDDYDSEISLLIGSDYYWNIVNGEIRRCNVEGLVAISSKIGWIFSGPVGLNEPSLITAANVTTHVMKVAVSIKDDLDTKVERFWKLDSLGINENESSVYDKFVDKIKFKNDRYEVRLPFKEEDPFIEDNYHMSLKRLTKLKQKLSNRPKLLYEYNDVIKKQLEMGIIEKVTTTGDVGRVTYLPHREVIREEKSSTKVRVVFDASAKGKGPSLNDSLYKGPCLNPLLFDMLIRFRVSNIAITADIKQAFLQIAVHPDDRDFLRFLWYDDVFSDEARIIKYRFNRVIFGATCSQFLLNGAIKLHLESYYDIDPEFTKKILKSFYVDDLNTGVNNIEEGVSLYNKLIQRFSDAKMTLCKWRTNDPTLRTQFSKNDISVIGDNVLGIKWNELEDELIIDLKGFLSNINDNDNYVVTKRDILSIVASFYDPVGYIQPVIVKLKIFFQSVCKQNITWNDPLSSEDLQKWNSLIDSIRKIEIVKIQRCYDYFVSHDPYTSIKLIGFSDASLVAYGCCIYLRYVSESGRTKISFVASKSRVAPLKRKETIPRLELLGNLILSRLVINVLNALCNEICIDEVLCFTDSQVSLAWIKSTDKELKTFVENRVKEIRRNVEPENWYYCRTNDNPADILTRIESNISNVMWFNGPSFIRHNFERESNTLNETDSCLFKEELKTFTVIHKTLDCGDINEIIEIRRFSCLLKLFRVTSFVIRFCKNIRAKLDKGTKELSKHVTSDEMRESRNLWIKANQRVLINNDNYEQLRIQLNCKKENDIIKVFGRMSNSRSTPPVLISKEHYLSTLIVLYCHEKVLHRGLKQTLNEFRSNYWVTKGRCFVKKIIHPCVICKKINCRPYSYPGHSDLPPSRFDEKFPFSSTGCDYLGPLNVLPV